jgi:hypothetical protein
MLWTGGFFSLSFPFLFFFFFFFRHHDHPAIFLFVPQSQTPACHPPWQGHGPFSCHRFKVEWEIMSRPYYEVPDQSLVGLSWIVPWVQLGSGTRQIVL